MAESDPVPVFKLNNSSDSFSAKSKDIFGCLSVIEKKHEAYQKTHSSGDDDDSLVKSDPEEEESQTSGGGPQRHQRRFDRSDRDTHNPQSRNRSDFARPYPPSRSQGHRGRGSRRTPDFKANPQRWTKYTLEDVDGKDLTESSNTRAAFEFLEERRRLREMADDPESFKAADVNETACSKGAITFVRKKKEKNLTTDVKVKDVSLPTDDGLEEESGVIPNVEKNLDEKCDSPKSEQKVTFKSKKGKQRNIRSRRDEDDAEDDQNG